MARTENIFRCFGIKGLYYIASGLYAGGSEVPKPHQTGKNVVAWWYTCRKLIWWLFFLAIMIIVSTNSYACRACEQKLGGCGRAGRSLG